MASPRRVEGGASPRPVLKLPHPFQTEYFLEAAPQSTSLPASPGTWSRLVPGAREGETATSSQTRTQTAALLHHDGLFFLPLAELKNGELPPQSDNGPWARAQRCPRTTFAWTGDAPTVAQAWLLVYHVLSARPGIEYFGLKLRGPGASQLGRQLIDVRLALRAPSRTGSFAGAELGGEGDGEGESLLVLRATFWQGAGSPFGPRPVWLPEETPSALGRSGCRLSGFPVTPVHHVMTILAAGDPGSPERTQQAWHPVRPAKPSPGSVIYSRWIPHLGETFSMVALDHGDGEHLRLFHEWQNDPRVSQGWNETGTPEQHREYLRRMHEDPHQLTVLARFDDVFFAYFEVYWAKEDKLGGYYDAGDFDRGRHSLVGDIRFRGPHRVTAWWSSLMHYLFLDDPRTMAVVGEPKETNSTVVMYDLMHGFGLEKFVDLPHKRSALVRCSRERFFQLCPLGQNEKAVGGMGITLVPKL